jgi:hypothetical protein
MNDTDYVLVELQQQTAEWMRLVRRELDADLCPLHDSGSLNQQNVILLQILRLMRLNR